MMLRLPKPPPDRLRALARAEMKLGPFDWDEWKQYRDEGRR